MANQTEATYKFDTFGWHHTAVAGVEVSREVSSIDSYTGLSSEALPGGFNGGGSLTGVSISNPQFTFLPFSGTPTLTGLPTKIAIDTTSGYLIDSANYHDLVILNGGIRYDDYNIKTSGFGTVNGVAGTFGQQAAEFLMPNFNLGITVKPLPITSVYVAYATSSDPVGSEFDGTSASLRGIGARPQRQLEPDIRAAEEHGDRGGQQMGIVRSPFAGERRTVPDQCHQCA